MSIHCYVGMPGSGKSYNAVENQIIPALRDGRTVVTNIPLNFDALRAYVDTGKVVEFPLQSVMQNPETIKDYVTNGCLFVLDEAWRIWPSGQKTHDIPEVYKSLLAEHRHMVAERINPRTGRKENLSTQVVLIVQDASNIATFARKLIESTFIHTKLSHVGAAGRFRVDIYHGPVTGTIGPKDKRDREIFGTYKKEIWSLYKSHTMSDSASDGALETPVDTRHNALKRPIFIVVIPLVLACAGYAAYHLVMEGKKFEHPEAHKIGAVPSSFASVPAKATAMGAEIYRPGALASAPKFRVVGYVRNVDRPEKSVAMLEGPSGKIFRGMDHCRTVDTDFVECEVAGTYYSQIGGSVADDSEHAVPVSAPLNQKLNYPIAAQPVPESPGVAGGTGPAAILASNAPMIHAAESNMRRGSR